MAQERSPVVNPDDAGLDNVSQEVEQVKGLQARVAQLEEMVERALKGSPLPPPEEIEIPEGRRAFVAPAHPNGKFMVKPGKIIQAPSPDGPRDIKREGDIWAQFKAGQLVTEDPKVIEWCEKHPEICRDIQDPDTARWVFIVEASRETANREAAIPRSFAEDGINPLVERARRAARGQ